MDPGTILAVIQLSAKTLSIIAEYYSDVKNAKNEIQSLKNELEHYRLVLLQVQRLLESANASELPMLDYLFISLRQCSSDLDELNRILEPKKSKITMSKFGLRAMQWPLSKDRVAIFLSELERRKSTLDLALSTYQTALIHTVKGAQDLEKLPYAKGAAFDDSEREHKHQCTTGTRKDLLSQVQKWSDDRKTRIFWLHAMAGMGKSTIAQTVAQMFTDQENLGASFFFARGEGDTGRATYFVTTIARQLAETFPQFRQHLCDAISSLTKILRQGLRKQWKELVVRPLSKVADRDRSWNIVIDALDECDSEDDVKLLLQLFMELGDSTGTQLSVFVTSRREPSIRLEFDAMPDRFYEEFALQDLSRSVMEKDIELFLQQEFQGIRKRRSMPDDWPERQQQDALIQKSDCLFIFVATVCRFIEDTNWNPAERLSIILSEKSETTPTLSALDNMYTQVLRISVTKDHNAKEKEILCARFREVVGTIVVAFNSLSVKALASLIQIPVMDVQLALNPLHSLLSVPKSVDAPLRLLHPSFRDYLLDSSRCYDPDFYIGQEIAHTIMTRKSLLIMRTSLRRDMCDLKKVGTSRRDIDLALVKSKIPEQVQYACQYWVDHLAHMKVGDRRKVGLRDDGEIHLFMKETFLHWLEVLSLIGIADKAIPMISHLESMVEGSKELALRPMILDAKRFVLTYKHILDEAPLQLYVSALLFSPKKSVIKGCYIDQIPRWIEKHPRVEEDWGPCIQVAEGQNDISAVEFLHKSHLLVSSSLHGSLRLWNPGTCSWAQSLEGHTSCIYKIAISYDNRLLASVSGDRTVRVWNLRTGAPVQTLQGHNVGAVTVIFSRNSQLLASAWDDNMVCLWNPATGECKLLVEGYGSEIFMLRDKQWIAFSNDSQLLASTLRNGTVRVWNTNTGVRTRDLEGHTDRVEAVAFSNDDKLLASASRDRSIRIWNQNTGKCLHILEHSDCVTALLFAPHSPIIASAYSNGTLRLWNLDGVCIQTLNGHLEEVHKMTFSHDGRLLASASVDSTVRLWDPNIGTCIRTLEGHPHFHHAVAFSHDCLMLASGKADGMRLWDPMIGTSVQTLEGHSDRVNMVAFSKDGHMVATASNDQTIRLWESETAGCIKTLTGHSKLIYAISFSLDNRLLASASMDKTVRLWDPQTGLCMRALETGSNFIAELAFSPDSRSLAIATPGDAVRLWDTENGLCTETLGMKLDGRPRGAECVVFSHDNQLLALALPNDIIWGTITSGAIRIWDLVKREYTQTLGGPIESFEAVAFSPNNQLLATAYYNTLSLWDLNTGSCTQVLDVHMDHISRLSLSPDDGRICTDRGELYIKPLADGFSLSRGSWAINQDWILYNGERALWLPSDFRSDKSDSWGTLFAIARPTGQLAFIGLSKAGIVS